MSKGFLGMNILIKWFREDTQFNVPLVIVRFSELKGKFFGTSLKEQY